jgi:uncharacterized protein DUF4129
VSRRLLLPLGVAVTGLLVLAAVASRGRPLHGGHAGRGPGTGFFDYAYTSALVVAGLTLVVGVWAVLSGPPARRRLRRQRFRLLSTLAFFAGGLLLAWAISTSGFQRRLHDAAQRAQTATAPTVPAGTLPKGGHGRGSHLRWDELGVVFALLGGVLVYAAVARARRKPPTPPWRRVQQTVSVALDESLDDLRADPDLRRAIVAAYARMEAALAAAGLPRRPAEAPLEFVARALEELEASGPSAQRLTDLFEWAKFSQHEPGPEMRDEAVEALVAVRDELRRPAEEPVAA